MPKLIFVSGASGSGKTETIAAITGPVLKIEVDAIQLESARRAFPFLRSGREYDWFLWPRDPSTIDLERLLELSIAGQVRQLAEHRGDLIAEGAILVNEWFRMPFRRALARLGHSFADADVVCLFLDAPPALMLEHIHQRAARWPHRRHERAHYPDVAAVDRLRNLHLAQLATGRWELVPDPQSLSTRLDDLLA